MSKRLKRYLYLFALTFSCMVAVLWRPFDQYLEQKETYQKLADLLKRKEALYKNVVRPKLFMEILKTA